MQARSGCFAVRRGGLERLDPKFIIYGGHQRLRTVHTAALGSLVIREPDYGAPCRSLPREAEEIKYIRVTDFDDFGIPEGHQFVTAETVEKRFILEDGDMLFARSGATAGKTFLYRKDLGPALFAGYCIRFRFDVRRVLPEFVYFYSKTDRYAAWVRSIQRPSGQPNINKEEFKSFTIPVPKIGEQERFVAALDAARAARHEKLAQADALFAGLDALVLGALGLKLPPPDDKIAYAATLADARYRFDANYHTPRFRELQRRLQRLNAVQLGTLCHFSEERVDPSKGVGSTFRYIEIGSVSSATGEALAVNTPRSEAPSRARMTVHAKDIIVSLTRPQRGSIALIDDSLDGCTASTGFAVLTDIDTNQVETSYLWAFLRTEAARLQMLQRSSGGNYPAITEDELGRILIPTPDGHIQGETTDEVARCRLLAARLRNDAARLWEEAKRNFEEELLGTKSIAEGLKAHGSKGGRPQ